MVSAHGYGPCFGRIYHTEAVRWCRNLQNWQIRRSFGSQGMYVLVYQMQRWPRNDGSAQRFRSEQTMLVTVLRIARYFGPKSHLQGAGQLTVRPDEVAHTCLTGPSAFPFFRAFDRWPRDRILAVAFPLNGPLVLSCFVERRARPEALIICATLRTISSSRRIPVHGAVCFHWLPWLQATLRADRQRSLHSPGCTPRHLSEDSFRSKQSAQTAGVNLHGP